MGKILKAIGFIAVMAVCVAAGYLLYHYGVLTDVIAPILP